VNTQGVIHDQGYERYTGERRPQRRRFLVIAKNAMAVAWRQKLYVRLPIIGAVLTAVVASGVMVVLSMLADRFRRLPATFSPDAIVLDSTAKFFGMFGFLLAVVVTAPAIADDLRAGAFQFYFSRPLRTRDYVLGKLLGVCTMVAIATLGGPVLLAIVRVGLADGFGEMMTLIDIVPKAAAVGLATTLSLALPAAALGALLRKRGPAMAAFAAYHLLVVPVAQAFARMLDLPQLNMVSTWRSVEAIAQAMMGKAPGPDDPGPWWGVLGLGLFVGGAVAIISWRVSSAERAGVGGGS
jgi:ABC-type transport system involved in multi-copper enzyme maturation permease subunit